MNDTIAAISTPTAPAGLGVIRLSGSDALTVAARVFKPVSDARTPDRLAGYTAAYGHVADSDGVIDECVLLAFRAPHSYTGEDVAEISCHGGMYVLQRTLRACFAAGARPAGAGEFTRRAFLNGKMDLTQAEGVMELIAANGRLAARTALAAREGATYRRLQAVKADLLAVAAQMGAYVDYPDDDIPALEPAALAATMESARAAIGALLATFDAGKVLREGVDTAIVGCPNVGKSTLMNCLAGCERSIVTAVAGTTRDVVEDTVRLGDVVLHLADTAGIRATDDLVESVGVEKARARLAQAALVLAVFDGSRPLTAEDEALISLCAGAPAIAVINKADLPQQADLDFIDFISRLARDFFAVVSLSAKEGTGIDALTSAVAHITGIENLDASEPVLATERQRDCATRCLAALDEAAASLDAGMTLDAVGVNLDDAIAAILELTGERATEAVVDEVFARFCVGK